MPLYFGDGSEPAAELDQAVEQLHNDLLDDCTDMKASCMLYSFQLLGSWVAKEACLEHK